MVCPLQWADVATRGVRPNDSWRLGTFLHDDESNQRNPLSLLLFGDNYFNIAHALYLFGYVDLVEEHGLATGFGPATAIRDNWLSVLVQSISGGGDSENWVGLKGACPPLAPHWPATARHCPPPARCRSLQPVTTCHRPVPAPAVQGSPRLPRPVGLSCDA